LEAAKDEDEDVTVVPKGQTGRWQPLDHRIFGELKSRARARFNAAYLEPDEPKVEKIWSICRLLECWDSIEQKNIIAAWNVLRK
jgi:hypothetical protein